MIEVLQFMFQDFWHWLGSFMMLGLVAEITTGVLTGILATFKR